MYFERNQEKLAYRKQNASAGDGRAGACIFLGGFRSDMEGTKATHLAAWARQNACDYLRFDYFGHGASSGDFAQATMSHWRDDVLAVLDELSEGKQILIGSSFGGFMSVLAALARPQRVAGLVLIAPAIDMTERLMWDGFTPDQRVQLERDGFVMRPSAYGEAAYPISRALIEDGRKYCLLGDKIDIKCPIRIIHGQKDDAVPYELSLEFMAALTHDDVELHLLKGGDHRLSGADELALLTDTIARLIKRG